MVVCDLTIYKDRWISKANIKYNSQYDYSEIDYIDSRHEVKIICKKHGEFYQSPINHLRTSGCSICLQDRFQKDSVERFIKKANIKHNNKYNYEKIDSARWDEKVDIICPLHGEFNQSVYCHLQGSGCSECGRLKAYNHSKQQIYTTEVFIAKAKEIHGDRYDYNKVNYISSKLKIIIVCSKHGEFKQLPSSHLFGMGCKQCVCDNSRFTIKEFIDKARSIHGNRYDYSKTIYKTAMEQINIVCSKHGEFAQRAMAHLEGHGCLLCAQNFTNFSTKEFINKAKLIHGDKYDYSMSEYTKSYNNITIGCNTHGIFNQIANNHLNGSGCPKCPIIISENHRKLSNLIKSWGIEVIDNDRTIISPLEIDIWIPKHQFGIECHGVYRHSSNNHEIDRRLKYRNYKKANYTNTINVKLLQLFDYELNNKIIISSIRHHLGFSNKLYARECSINLISRLNEQNFMSSNHRQGFQGSTVCYGLFYNNELMAAMSFIKNNDNWKLQRFATKLNYVIIGGASKLFKKFINDYNPKSIITFADRRFSDGKLYDILGFTKILNTKPNYQYINHNGNIRFSRQQCMKHKLSKLLKNYDSTLTEVDNMFNNGYRRLWDAGNIKYLWTLKK